MNRQEFSFNLHLRFIYLAYKNPGCLVELKIQIKQQIIFFFKMKSVPWKIWTLTYTNTIVIVYLKLEFQWVSWALSGNRSIDPLVWSMTLFILPCLILKGACEMTWKKTFTREFCKLQCVTRAQGNTLRISMSIAAITRLQTGWGVNSESQWEVTQTVNLVTSAGAETLWVTCNVLSFLINMHVYVSLVSAHCAWREGGRERGEEWSWRRIVKGTVSLYFLFN